MATSLQQWTSKLTVVGTGTPSSPTREQSLLTASGALKVLRHRTGIPVSRASFYRWLSNGRVLSVRMGQKLYIPSEVIERIVEQSEAGDKLW